MAEGRVGQRGRRRARRGLAHDHDPSQWPRKSAGGRPGTARRGAGDRRRRDLVPADHRHAPDAVRHRRRRPHCRPHRPAARCQPKGGPARCCVSGSRPATTLGERRSGPPRWIRSAATPPPSRRTYRRRSAFSTRSTWSNSLYCRRPGPPPRSTGHHRAPRAGRRPALPGPADPAATPRPAHHAAGRAAPGGAAGR